MSWQAIRGFQIGDERCESNCGHFHKSPMAAAKCGYRTWSHGNSNSAAFSELVRFVGNPSFNYFAVEEIQCRMKDGQIILIALENKPVV